jgi:hypothetical protein
MSCIARTGWANIAGSNYFLEEYALATGKPFNKTDRFLSALYGGSDYYLPLNNEQDFLRAFKECMPLKAITGKRAKAFNTGKTIITNTNTENPARGNVWLKNLIKKPNVLQREKQFFAQQNHYVDIFGYCPVMKIEVPGFEGSGEYSAVWNIPPWLFDLDYTGKWLKQFKRDGIYREFFIFWNGEKHSIKFESLFFVFDDGIGTECDTNLTIPDSRLVGMDYIISNIQAAYKSRNTLITRRGAMGILSNSSNDKAGTIPIDPTEKENVQRSFAQYGLTGQPYQIIITDAALKWEQMGYPTKDLMLFEETTENIERLCDAYGWPIELIARGKDVTYDNKIQARKDLYQNTIIPESDSRMEQFSFGLLGDESTLSIARDYSEVPVLQTDLKTKAETRKAVNEYCKQEYDAGLMTKNEWRDELGLPRIEGKPEFDEYKTDVKTDPLKENEDGDDDEDPTSED